MKQTAKVIRQRIEELASLKLLGALWTDIRQHADRQEWNVSERQLHRYLSAADEVIAESVEKNRDTLMAHHFCARRALFARAMSVSDYGVALRCLESEAALLDLLPARRSEITGKHGSPLFPSLEQMVAALAQADASTHEPGTSEPGNPAPPVGSEEVP